MGAASATTALWGMLLALLTLLGQLRVAEAGTAKFDVNAMIRMFRNGDPVLSPGKDLYVYTQTYYEGTDASIGKMILQKVKDTTYREEVCQSYASHPGNPVWLSDKTLLLTNYDENGVNQIWEYNTETKACNKRTSYAISIDNLKVSPKLDYVVFSAEVYYHMNLSETAEREMRRGERPYDVYRFTTPYVRHWDSWIEADKFYHLFMATITFNSSTGVVSVSEGEPIDIMYDLASDSPLRPFGDRSQYDISPDGTHVSFITQTGEERAWNTNDMLYVSTFDASVGMNNLSIKLECMTCEEAGYKYSNARAATPMFITNNVLVFLGMEEEKSESDQSRLVEYNITNNKYEFKTGTFDYSIGSMILDNEYSDVSNEDSPVYRLFLVVSHYARERIFVYDSSTKQYTQISANGTVSGLNLISTSSNDAVILYGYNSFTSPTEIYKATFNLAKVDVQDREQLSHDNDDILSEYELIQPGEFTTNSTEEDGSVIQVQHYYFLPSGFDHEKNKDTPPPPLILYIHGGPESPWYDGWSYRWNPQAWVSQGYSLVLTNFHGSDSFGLKFTKSILRHWYEAMYDDIKAGKDYMIKQGWGDPNRIGTSGASFGCNTIFWILGHNDVNSIVNVCHDGVFDPRMSATDTEELYFPFREFGGFSYDPDYRKIYDEKNASLFVNNWETPTLVIHGGMDFRIPETHGIAAFQALRRRGIDSKFLYFPTQSHWVYAPQESVIWHNTVMEWLDEHLHSEYK